MPAFYAHNRFGALVAGQMNGELNEIISSHYAQFAIGLQGPDIFFFYKPYSKNRVTQYGYHLHDISAYPFFEHALKIVKEKGRNSKEYAYLMGFICHYILDSEYHPYVEEMIGKTGVLHLEIEEEFEKMLLRLDGNDPLSYPVADLVPTDNATAKAVYPFYKNINPIIVKESLQYLKLVKKIFTAPGFLKQTVLNSAMHLTGNYAHWKGLMNQRKDNPNCQKTNEGLLIRFQSSIDIAVDMINEFDESLQTGKELNKRFDRTFS